MATSAASPTSAAASPEAELARLHEDLTSAHVRNRTLIKALTRAAVAPTVVGAIPGTTREHDETVFLSNGVKLERRWDAEHGWRYVQAACIPGTVAAVVDAAFVAIAGGAAEMAVVTG